MEKGQEKLLLWNCLFERPSTGLVAKGREYYIYWKKKEAPSFPSFSFSEWFERLDIYFFFCRELIREVIREVISTMEELRKSSAFEEKKPCLCLFLGIKPTIVCLVQLFWSHFFHEEAKMKLHWADHGFPEVQFSSYHPFFFFPSLNFPSGLLLCCSHAASFPMLFWSKFSGTVKTSLRTNAEWGHWLILTHRLRSPSYWVISLGLQNLTLHVHR